MKLLKILVLIIFVLCTNCSSGDCGDGDVENNFPAKFKIVSSSGVNQLILQDFDKSLLKILSGENSKIDLEFSIKEFKGELVVECQVINTDIVVFQYNQEDLFKVLISDLQTETNDCFLEVLSFKASTENEGLLCNCAIDDIVTVEFEI